MSKSSTVSIILPNYNSSEYITETIDSIINQTFKNWQLIIVDDHSDAKTKSILKNYNKNKKIKIYFLNKNKGAAYCRNFALKKTKSSYVAFIDSDDIWEKNKLDMQIKTMKKRKYGFTYTNYKTFKDGETDFKYVSVPSSFDYKKFIKNTSIATSSMVVKKELLKNIEFTNTKICEDYFFKCQILKKTKAYLINDFLIYYRIRKNSLQSNPFKNFFWIWKINKNFNKLNILENIFSLVFISLNSFLKYGLK